MRNDLNRASVIMTPALTLNDRLIYLAGGGVVGFGQKFVDKPFIVANIQVGFSAIVCNVHLAMLVWVHRTRIHIKIWV